MPLSQVVGVVALAWVTCRRAKVVVIPGCARHMIVMVAWNRFGAVLVATPGWAIAVTELACCSIWVGIVTQGENRARNVVEKFCGCLILRTTAVGYIAGPYKDWIR